MTDAAAPPNGTDRSDTADVLVVGGGIAGCVAALAAARERPTAAVELLVTVDDRFDRHSGTIDILGYPARTDETARGTTDAPGEHTTPGSNRPVVRPLDAIEELPETHPYRRLGRDRLRAALALFDDELDYQGNEHNALVVTHTGRVRPTARYPPGMAAGLASRNEPMGLVGIEQAPDLDAALVADRLDECLPYDVAGTTVEFPGTVTEYPSGPTLARALDGDTSGGDDRLDDDPAGDSDDPGSDGAAATSDGAAATSDGAAADSPGESVRERFVERVRSELGVEPRVGFPAVLGEADHAAVRRDLEEATHAHVFEVPIGPPSIPGRRLESGLHGALSDAGVTVTHGEVTGFEAADGAIERVSLADGGRRVESVVLATGDLAGPGLVADRAGVHEPVFGCHVDHPDDRADWTAPAFLGEHPFARFGVAVDDDLRPVDGSGRPEYDNLRAAGTVLGGVDYAAQHSADGIALVTGYAAGRWSLP